LQHESRWCQSISVCHPPVAQQPRSSFSSTPPELSLSWPNPGEQPCRHHRTDHARGRQCGTATAVHRTLVVLLRSCSCWPARCFARSAWSTAGSTPTSTTQRIARGPGPGQRPEPGTTTPKRGSTCFKLRRPVETHARSRRRVIFGGIRWQEARSADPPGGHRSTTPTHATPMSRKLAIINILYTPQDALRLSFQPAVRVTATIPDRTTFVLEGWAVRLRRDGRSSRRQPRVLSVQSSRSIRCPVSTSSRPLFNRWQHGQRRQAAPTLTKKKKKQATESQHLEPHRVRRILHCSADSRPSSPASSSTGRGHRIPPTATPTRLDQAAVAMMGKLIDCCAPRRQVNADPVALATGPTTGTGSISTPS